MKDFIFKFDSDLNIINIYKTQVEAAEDSDASKQAINGALKGKINTVDGCKLVKVSREVLSIYLNDFLKENLYSTKKKSRKSSAASKGKEKQPVIATTKRGREIFYESITKAANSVKPKAVSPSSILYAIGHGREYKGHVWKRG